MVIIQLYGSPLLEREMDTLTRAEIYKLHRQHLLRRTIEVAIVGIIGGVTVGMAIGIMIVKLNRAF
jgi:hypothetical protein